MRRVQQVEHEREEELDHHLLVVAAHVLRHGEGAAEEPHDRAHRVRLDEGALVRAVVALEFGEARAVRRIRVLLLLQVVVDAHRELLGLHRELHDHLEAVEGELRVRVAGRLQQRHEVRLQHAPRAERAVRCHHDRVVAPQVPLQVGDAVLALGADHVALLGL